MDGKEIAVKNVVARLSAEEREKRAALIASGVGQFSDGRTIDFQALPHGRKLAERGN